MNIPLVSVIMITYNHEKFIREAVEGVLSQITDFNFELIIANDCSPDKTIEIINKILSSHPKAELIKFINNIENWGANRNYMNAYNHGKGKYIAVCEGDDYWGDETKLQKQVNFLEENPDYVLTYHDAICVDEKGSVLENVSNARPKKELTELELKQGNQPLYLTTCYRKLPIDLPNEMVDIINGDTFLTSILGNYGKGKWLNIKPAYYRHHPGGVWSLQQKEYKFKAKIQLFSALIIYYKTQNSQELKDYFENQLLLHNKMLLSFYIKQMKYLSFLKYILKNYNLLFKIQ